MPDLIWTNHPQINKVLEKYKSEKVPFVKVHQMIDLFEILIKTHTAYVIADYFRINNLSDYIKGLLAQGLIKPSLGYWKELHRETIFDLIFLREIDEEKFTDENLSRFQSTE